MPSPSDFSVGESPRPIATRDPEEHPAATARLVAGPVLTAVTDKPGMPGPRVGVSTAAEGSAAPPTDAVSPSSCVPALARSAAAPIHGRSSRSVTISEPATGGVSSCGALLSSFPSVSSGGCLSRGVAKGHVPEGGRPSAAGAASSDSGIAKYSTTPSTTLATSRGGSSSASSSGVASRGGRGSGSLRLLSGVSRVAPADSRDPVSVSGAATVTGRPAPALPSSGAPGR
mmetsp:Transcript_3735/g.8901  ORF Transcript_3735/g.8901 Transcript_3735/m.8901 type:complete len:229 (-) Transcript_3735:601-1287(-)